MEGTKRDLEKVTFAMKERVFDPEKDKGPLQGKLLITFKC